MTLFPFMSESRRAAQDKGKQNPSSGLKQTSASATADETFFFLFVFLSETAEGKYQPSISISAKLN